MKKIAIIGGGIAGLSAAWHLEQKRKAGADVSYTLYEGSSRLGGVIRTEYIDGCVVEAGPDSWISQKPAGAELCRALGLGDELIRSKDETRKTYIALDNSLIEIPDGLMFMIPTKILPMVGTKLFSWGGKITMARELLEGGRFKRQHTGKDESVATFVKRHFGQEMVDRLADPLLAGVYGGNADRLSIKAVLPGFFKMEAEEGSLARATLKARAEQQAKAKANGNAAGSKQGPAGPAPSLFTTLRNGMQQMIDALVAQIDPASIRLNTPVRTVEPSNGQWLVANNELRSDVYDEIIIAMPAHKTAELLRSAHPELAALLGGMTYTSSIAVALGYDEKQVKLPDGFGILVPRTENRSLLAATFVHNKFPYRTPPGKLLLRTFLGGDKSAEAMPKSDEEILSAVRKDLKDLLGITAEPLFGRVYRWQEAMAQYEVGHLDRMYEVRKHVSDTPGLHLIGNAYEGIGVPDCIRLGKLVAEKVAAPVAVAQ